MYTVANGYTPQSYQTILTSVVAEVNKQFNTNYTNEQFEGTNLWKVFYTGIQELMGIENKITELSVKLQDYIRTQNEELLIQRSSVDGFIQGIEEDLNLIASIKPIETPEEAGHLSVAVDLDDQSEDYQDKKNQVIKKMHDWLTAGLFYEGTEEGQVTATNGQEFNYAFNLPTETALKIKITVRVSDNKSLFVLTPNEIKNKFIENFNKLYRLGFDFEPQTYLCLEKDLPFASAFEVEYSTDGGSEYKSDVLKTMYDEKITFNPSDVIVEVL